MGSATRQAVAAAKAALAARQGAATLALGEELLSAGRLIGRSAPLRTVLTDPSIEALEKSKIVSSVFGAVGADAKALLTVLAEHRWSKQGDLLAGVEEIGIRVLADSASDDTDIPAELFAFSRLVSSSAELELAVGNKLGEPAAKVALVESLLSGKTSEQTVAIVSQLVQQPRGRRIGALIRHAADIVADQASVSIATVTVATPLSDDQLERLRAGLAGKYGALRVQQVIDAEVIGGVRIVIGDDVIDDTVATRLKDLRLQLAG